jgi:AcrR family transcriptional regulator
MMTVKTPRRGVGRPRKHGPAADTPSIELSRSSVVEAALALSTDAKSDGVFTVNRLAVKLGVTPMTIHYHFGDKASVVRMVMEDLNGRVRRDMPTHKRPWRQFLIDTFSALFVIYSPYPGIVRAILSELQTIRPNADAGIFDMMEAVSRRLVDSGFSPFGAAMVWHQLTLFTMTMAERPLYHQEPGEQRMPQRALANMPTLQLVYPEFLKLKSDDVYRLGLEAMVRGLQKF